jgi:hypothetical protein
MSGVEKLAEILLTGPDGEPCEHCGSKDFFCDWDFGAGESPCHLKYLASLDRSTSTPSGGDHG